MLTELERQKAHVLEVRGRLRGGVPKILENHVALPVADPQPRSSTPVVAPLVPVEIPELGIISAERLLEIEQLTRELCAELRHAKYAASQAKVAAHPTVPIKTIIKTTADYYKVSVADIASARRYAFLLTPRHVAMYLAKELTLASYPAIAKHFGDRDHTTIMSGVSKIALKRLTSPFLDQQINEIAALLTGAGA